MLKRAKSIQASMFVFGEVSSCILSGGVSWCILQRGQLVHVAGEGQLGALPWCISNIEALLAALHGGVGLCQARWMKVDEASRWPGEVEQLLVWHSF